MPSGDEWMLPVDPDLTILRDCAAAICDVWPDAVVEDTAAGEFAHTVEALVPVEESELCVYRDLETTRCWQHGVPRDKTRNSMIQISLTTQGVRLIADDWRDPRLTSVVAKICGVVSGQRIQANAQE